MIEVSGVVVGRRSGEAIAERLAAARTARLSYGHVGSTIDRVAPPGFTSLEVHIVVRGTVPAARRALRGWAAHAGIGATIAPVSPPEEGSTVLVVASLGPFEVVAPDRVVAVVDEADRCAFAYATLEGHPEEGEERFEAEVVGAGRVRLTVRAHSRPADRLGGALGPLVRRLQRAAAERYLAAWAEAIAADRTHGPPDAGPAAGPAS